MVIVLWAARIVFAPDVPGSVRKENNQKMEKGKDKLKLTAFQTSSHNTDTRIPLVEHLHIPVLASSGVIFCRSLTCHFMSA